MTAFDFINNIEFRTFCDLWIKDGRPVLEFSDWCREYLTEDHALAVEEAHQELWRDGNYMTKYVYGARRPWRLELSYLVRWTAEFKERSFRSYLPLDVFNRLCLGAPTTNGYNRDYSNPTEAIADYLEAFAIDQREQRERRRPPVCGGV